SVRAGGVRNQTAQTPPAASTITTRTAGRRKRKLFLLRRALGKWEAFPCAEPLELSTGAWATAAAGFSEDAGGRDVGNVMNPVSSVRSRMVPVGDLVGACLRAAEPGRQGPG